jgi:predicted short-subunit dehydrogenase-like oxidoreductase (DUF2520 family)
MPALDVTIIGPGRVGRSLAASLRAAGHRVTGPLGRDRHPDALGPLGVALLCVPDAAIADVAGTLPAGWIVGHCSASVPLDVLAPHERFSAHPLLSVTGDDDDFRGAACAIDASTARAAEVAGTLARSIGMVPIDVPPERRALYHAAASTAANYLITLEAAAERLAAAAGIERAQLLPLVRAAVRQWERLGGARALTGPIARGDEATVARQRAAVAASAPDLLPLWDALADATRVLARERGP